MVDTLDLGSSAARRGGSSPSPGYHHKFKTMSEFGVDKEYKFDFVIPGQNEAGFGDFISIQKVPVQDGIDLSIAESVPNITLPTKELVVTPEVKTEVKVEVLGFTVDGTDDVWTVGGVLLAVVAGYIVKCSIDYGFAVLLERWKKKNNV